MAAYAGVALLLAACGGGDHDASSTLTYTPAVTAEASATPRETSRAHDLNMCALLSADDIARVSGYELGVTTPHNGPGTLHFCTMYLEIDTCRGHCAISVEDLGAVSENNYNTPELYRQVFERANPDATATFRDGVLGDNSWLATVSTTDLPEWKLLYFQIKGTAFDIGAPRVPDYVPTADQMIQLGQAVIDKLQ